MVPQSKKGGATAKGSSRPGEDETLEMNLSDIDNSDADHSNTGSRKFPADSGDGEKDAFKKGGTETETTGGGRGKENTRQADCLH